MNVCCFVDNEKAGCASLVSCAARHGIAVRMWMQTSALGRETSEPLTKKCIGVFLEKKMMMMMSDDIITGANVVDEYIQFASMYKHKIDCALSRSRRLLLAVGL